MAYRFGKNARLIEDLRIRALEQADSVRTCFGLVYLITNSITGDRYVGATATGLTLRWHYHKQAAFRYNKRTRLYMDMRRYGAQAFIVECVELCFDRNKLAEMERVVIEHIKPEYNIITVPDDIWSEGRLMKLLTSDKPLRALAALLLVVCIGAAPSSAADNFAINNATGTFTILKSTDDGTGVQQLNVLSLPQQFVVVGSTLTRPANADVYAALDSVSNSATAGSVTAQSTNNLSDTADLPINLAEILVDSIDTGPGTAGAILRYHIYNTDPTLDSGVVNGDNAAYSNKKAGWVGSFSGVMRPFSNGSKGVLIPDEGTLRIVLPASGATNLWYQVQTLTIFTPSANSTTFIPTFKGYQGRL